MKQFQRVVSFLLALCLSAQMLPQTAIKASAAETETTEAPAATQQISEESVPETTAETTLQETVPETAPAETAPSETAPEETSAAEQPPVLNGAALTENGYTYTVASAGTATVTGYSGSETALTVPATLGGYPVTTIAEKAFQGNKALTSIMLPDSITTIGAHAFENCTLLEEITLPASLTEMGAWAFMNCDSLTSVTVPEGITVIRESTFNNCNSLTSVTLPDGLTTVGPYAFAYNPALESIHLPDSITTIYYRAFQNCTALREINIPVSWETVVTWGNSAQIFIGCSSLTSVSIPEGLTAVPAYAFHGCNNLKEVVLHDNITSIGEHAFEESTAFTELVLPAALTELGRWAFMNCETMTSVVIPEGITVIRESTFNNCNSLTSVTLPDGLTTVGPYAFAYNPVLESIHLPDSITTIYYRAFASCTSLNSVNIPLNWTTVANGSIKGGIFHECPSLLSITVPEGISAIPDYGFEGCTKLEEVILPSTLTSIGNYAFQLCVSLNTITIPESVTTINKCAFYECTSLKSIHIPDSVTTISYRAFANCTSLSSVNIPLSWNSVPSNGSSVGGVFLNCSSLPSIAVPEGITALPDYAFEGATCLEEIILPDTLTSIGNYAFQHCTVLKTVEIPDSVTTIGKCAFRYCVGLPGIALPKKVTTIGDSTFDGCTSLTEVSLPENLEKIGLTAFRDCTSLTSIHIPDSVTTISYRAFANCTSLSSVNLPLSWNSVPSNGSSVGGIFLNCSSLPSITVPKGITALPDYAFEGATCLEEIILPDTLTSIGNYAFQHCTVLKTIEIPNSVSSIGQHAFRYCNELTVRCSISSPVLVQIILSAIPFVITDYSLPDSMILDRNTSSYDTNSGSTSSSGYLDMVLRYTIREDQAALLKDKALRILLPPELLLLESSLKLDNVLCKYTYKDNCLTIPVTASSGTVRFCVQPTASTPILTRADLTYTKDGAAGMEVIGYISSDRPLITLSAPATTNSSSIQVSGIAPSGAAVSFYINDQSVGSATASKAGNYRTTITIPNPEDGKTYAVKAVVSVGTETLEKIASVTYDISKPVLEELLLYYSGHDSRMHYYNRVVDMTNPAEGKTVITFNPNHDYTFRAKMTNPDMVSKLYVTSTRNGVVKAIEAEYDAKTGYFVTSGKFDGANTSYVPGEIGIAYDLSYAHIDKNDEYVVADALIKDTIQYTDFSDVSMTVLESSETDLNLQTNLPDGTDINYEYHEFTAEELYAYLVEKGVIAESDDVSAHGTFDLSDLLGEYGKKYLVNGKEAYLGETERGFIMVTGKTVTDSEVFCTWGIESVTTELIDNALGPDSFIADNMPNGPTIGGIAAKSGIAVYKYFDKMWELDMNTAGKTPAQLQQIEETKEVLTFVMISRIVLACAQASLAVTCPGATAAVFIGSFLVEDLLDSFEKEGSWVAGLENSFLGIALTARDKLFGWQLTHVFGFLQWIIDPSGYVYEAVTTNRLSGVTATVYYKDPDTGTAVKWNAEEYDQINPIITYTDGVYAWDVPEGLWQVKYELEGYETVYSDWMEVPPPQTDVNVGLVSKAVPEVTCITVHRSSVELSFSKYMDPATAKNVTLLDSSGAEIPYTLHYSTEETSADGSIFAEEFTLEFQSAKLNTGESCTVRIPGTVTSYAGIGVAEQTKTVPCTEEITVSPPEQILVPYGEEAAAAVTISAADIAELTVVSLFEELADVTSVKNLGNGKWQITVSGKMTGTTALELRIPGTNIVRQIPVDVGTKYEAEPPAAAAVTRIAGASRYQTAITAANQLKDILGIGKFDSIIIASGTNFADALAGSYLAAVKSAPILLSTKKSDQANLEYIQENLKNGGTVYILGGTGAVSDSIEILLKNEAISVKRLAGKDRYKTNLLILEEAGFSGGEVLVAIGNNFADSLSASATGKPILLVGPKWDKISVDYVNYLSGKPCSFTIIGGEGAVKAAIETDLKNYGEVRRIFGSNRLQTSVKVAETYFSNPDTVFLAYSANFPDGLCGGPVAHALGAPLLLVNTNKEATPAAYVSANNIKTGYIMGGDAAVSDESIKAVFPDYIAP